MLILLVVRGLLVGTKMRRIDQSPTFGKSFDEANVAIGGQNLQAAAFPSWTRSTIATARNLGPGLIILVLQSRKIAKGLRIMILFRETTAKIVPRVLKVYSIRLLTFSFEPI